MASFIVKATVYVQVDVDGEANEYDEQEIISFARDIIFDEQYDVDDYELVFSGEVSDG